MKRIAALVLCSCLAGCSFGYRRTANLQPHPERAAAVGDAAPASARAFGYPITGLVVSSAGIDLRSAIDGVFDRDSRFRMLPSRAVDLGAAEDACDAGRGAGAETVIWLAGGPGSVWQGRRCLLDLTNVIGDGARCLGTKQTGYEASYAIEVRYLRVDGCELLHVDRVEAHADRHASGATAATAAQTTLAQELRREVDTARRRLYTFAAAVAETPTRGRGRLATPMAQPGRVYELERGTRTIGFVRGTREGAGDEIEALFGLGMVPGDRVKDTGLLGFVDIRPHASLLGARLGADRRFAPGAGAQLRWRPARSGLTLSSSAGSHLLEGLALTAWDLQVGRQWLVLPGGLILWTEGGLLLADLHGGGLEGSPMVGILGAGGLEVRLAAMWFLSAELGYAHTRARSVAAGAGRSFSTAAVRGPLARIGVIWRL